MPAGRVLCRLDDIPDGGSRGFAVPGMGDHNELFVIRRGAAVLGYVNNCPHTGAPLNWMPDQFLAFDRQYVLCTVHGALFQIDDGLCIDGPCVGRSLTAVALAVVDGSVLLPEPA